MRTIKTKDWSNLSYNDVQKTLSNLRSINKNTINKTNQTEQKQDK